jgi:hypothetical protein
MYMLLFKLPLLCFQLESAANTRQQEVDQLEGQNRNLRATVHSI